MRVLFFGSPEFAVPSLEALCASAHPVLAVVTQPDRPTGRGLEVRPSAVKRRALGIGLEVLTPARLDSDFLAACAGRAPEVLAVVAYGRILPTSLLSLPRLGAINVHGSLLPRHRGASPVQAAILAGDATTGVTTMQMEAGLDTGPMWLQRESAIGADETAGELAARLSRLGAGLLVETLDALERGELTPRPQDPGLATWAPRIRSADAVVDWQAPAEIIARRVRAYQPWPGASTTLPAGSRLKLLQVRVAAAPSSPAAGAEALPGTIVAVSPAGVEVLTGSGVLVLLRAQPEGRRPQSAQDLINGQRLRAGARLGA